MNKIILLSLSCTALIVTCYASDPNPFASIKEVTFALDGVRAYIEDIYAKQFTEFTISATPKVNQIVTSETLKNFTTLKKSLTEVALLVEPTQLQEESKNLKTFAITMINKIQVIDGNLQTYFDMFPDSQEYKKIIDEALNSLKKIETDAQKIVKLFAKPKRAPYIGDPEVIQAQVTMVHDAAVVVADIAKVARETTQKILDSVTVKAKKPGLFKRIFGKKS